MKKHLMLNNMKYSLKLWIGSQLTETNTIQVVDSDMEEIEEIASSVDRIKSCRH